MAAMGMMHEGYFVGRNELSDWIRGHFDPGFNKIEDLASGVVYCKIINSIYPGAVALQKVKKGMDRPHLLIFELSGQALGDLEGDPVSSISQRSLRLLHLPPPPPPLCCPRHHNLNVNSDGSLNFSVVVAVQASQVALLERELSPLGSVLGLDVSAALCRSTIIRAFHRVLHQGRQAA